MSFEKKSFDGDFLKYYTIIKSYGAITVREMYDYKPSLDTINSFYWEGSSKDSISNNVGHFDEYCNILQLYGNYLVKRTKIVCDILGPELKLLKEKIETYNKWIDEYEKTKAQLQLAMTEAQKDGETA